MAFAAINPAARPWRGIGNEIGTNHEYRNMAFSNKRFWSAMNLGGLTAREVAIRTWRGMNDHEILTRAAAISFYAIAALVPFLRW